MTSTCLDEPRVLLSLFPTSHCRSKALIVMMLFLSMLVLMLDFTKRYRTCTKSSSTSSVAIQCCQTVSYTMSLSPKLGSISKGAIAKDSCAVSTSFVLRINLRRAIVRAVRTRTKSSSTNSVALQCCNTLSSTRTDSN